MVVIIPAFLSPKECDEIISWFPSVAPGEVDHGDGAEVSTVRKSRVAFLPSAFSTNTSDDDIVSHVYNTLLETNRRHYHYDIAGCEPLQFAEYGVGGEYGEHLDIGPGTASLRKLSASVQLSPPDSYDGGDLKIFGCAPADRDQGSLIIFPSWSTHRVAPVTRGVRCSLVGWAFGLRPFR